MSVFWMAFIVIAGLVFAWLSGACLGLWVGIMAGWEFFPPEGREK